MSTRKRYIEAGRWGKHDVTSRDVNKNNNDNNDNNNNNNSDQLLSRFRQVIVEFQFVLYLARSVSVRYTTGYSKAIYLLKPQ